MEPIVQIRADNDSAGLIQELEKLRSVNEALSNNLNELLKESNQFAYIVSHDLQAPLRMITGFLELLEKKYGDKLDASAKQYIDFAVKGAVKMKSLIFDLLDYSRLSSLPKEFVETDLNEVINEVNLKFSSVAEETNTRITISKLPVIIADKKQMFQMFHHLIGNALKFRSETVIPEINISAREENGKWLILVKDNGIGMDPAFSEKIFAVFRRLHSDESKYKGTGIGLAMCKKIAELHGGDIGVESEVGNGSCFFFTLPSDNNNFLKNKNIPL